MLARARVATTDSSARLTLKALLIERARAIAFVASACRAAHVPLDCEHEIVSAFGEAFNNVVLHSYRDVSGLIEVELERLHDRFIVRLRDSGAGFDPSRLRAPDLELLPESGMGLFIMLRAMDEVRWAKEGVENVVTLVKRIPHA